jgi:3-isopropylmalate/(R)-2-methylmalate dehydratase large subunit
MSLVENIIAMHAGRDFVSANEIVDVFVDRVYVQDGNSPTIAKYYKEYGLNGVFDKKKVALFFDHSVLPPNVNIADRLAEAKTFAKNTGVQVFAQGEGISHVLALENGWFFPGGITLGADSHTCTGGAIQSLALGMGASDIAAAMVSGRTWLKVPETVWIKLSGRPTKSVRGRDIVFHCLSKFGQAMFLYKSIEWLGEWLEEIELDEAASIASLGVELGAKCVFLPPGPNRPLGMSKIVPEPNGVVLEVDLSEIEPIVAKPHSPGNVVNLNLVSVERIDHVFIGSCTNSRLQDMKEVASILEGKKVHPDIHMVITPGSRSVYLQAIKEGYVEIFIKAGAIVTPPGCGACVGAQGSIPSSGDRIVSTMNRNFQGRMGNPNADIFLASPIIAANAALTGHLPTMADLG